MEYAIFAFLVCFLLAGSGLLLLFYREALSRRLGSILTQRGTPVPTVTRVQRAAESLGVFASSVQRIVPKSEKETSVVQKRLILAGMREERFLNLFYAAKAVVPVLLCGIVFATGIYRESPFIIFLLALAIGYLAPDYWLSARINNRENEIRMGLADVLDLLVVCLEAGLSLDNAVVRAVEEMEISHPVLADELGLVMLEVRAGKPRADAWRSLADRTDLDVIRMLVAVLIQADQYGTGISKTLRVHADTMRTRRRQRIEEMAAKTSVKLVFPLVLCIFPSIFVVILGSAFIQLSEAFKK